MTGRAFCNGWPCSSSVLGLKAMDTCFPFFALSLPLELSLQSRAGLERNKSLIENSVFPIREPVPPTLPVKAVEVFLCRLAQAAESAQAHQSDRLILPVARPRPGLGRAL